MSSRLPNGGVPQPSESTLGSGREAGNGDSWRQKSEGSTLAAKLVQTHKEKRKKLGRMHGPQHGRN